MNLEFTEEQRLLSNMVERFTADHYDVNKRASYIGSETGFSADNWEIMADMGLLTVPFSERNGGMDGTAEDLICIMQPLGKAVAVEPLLFGTTLAGSFLDRTGTTEQQEAWVHKLISGEAQIALAHVEADARYDLELVKTRYKTNGKTTYLKGQKTFVLGAGAASAFIISAVADTDDAAKTNAMSFFLVDRDAEGLSVKNYRLIDGSVACQLELNNTPSSRMNGTFDDLMQAIALTKIAACAEMVGLMECLFEATLEHVKTREQFGRPLSKFQVISHRLSEAYASLELCRSHVMRLAALDVTDTDYIRNISGAKAFISKAAIEMAEEAVQMHGGMGITDELIVGHAFKRVLLLSSLFGDVDTELRNYC